MLIACPSCQRQLNVPDHAVGKQVRCPAPDCGTVFYVPAAAPPPPPPVAAAPAAPPRPAAAAKPAVKSAAAPAPAAPTPAAPPPASASPFDFGGGGPVSGPEADFGFTERHDGGLKGIGLRTRIGRAAGWLNMAAGSMVLLTIYSISILITLFALSGGYRAWQGWATVGGSTCFLVVLLAIPTCIVVGARLLARARSWGMALTATIMSLVVGALSLLITIGCSIWTAMTWFTVGIAVAVRGGVGTGGGSAVLILCGADVLAAIVAFCGISAGIVGLRTLLNAEVKRAFS